MKNKQVKPIWLNVATKVLGLDKELVRIEYLEYCEYDGKLKVFQHWEEPYPLCEGVVGEGRYKLGVVSLTANQLKSN